MGRKIRTEADRQATYDDGQAQDDGQAPCGHGISYRRHRFDRQAADDPSRQASSDDCGQAATDPCPGEGVGPAPDHDPEAVCCPGS